MRLATATAALLAAVTAAQATTFTLNNDNCTGTCGQASYGTATITQEATGVEFVISLTGGSVFQLTGNGLNLVNFGFTGQSFTNANLVINSFNGPNTAFNFVQPNPNQDGFGDFLHGVNGDSLVQGTNHGGTLLDFTITGALLANLAFSQNGGESTQIAVDIFGVNGNTGLVGGTPGGLPPPPPPPPEVPIPGAVWLFGSGLAGLVLLHRKRKTKNKQLEHAAQ